MIAALVAGICLGCGGAPGGGAVVVYCALDREFAEPILQRFEQETGVHVRASYDVESTKSVGFAEQLQRERMHPRCDVFWNNEPLNTLRLDKANVLAANPPTLGQNVPPEYRANEGRWFGFAGRARIILANHVRLGAKPGPQRLQELVDPKWRGQVGIAKPLFGTTATHLACLFAAWGPQKTKDWLHGLKANGVRVCSGNKQVAVLVGNGELTVGLTDTDDALAEIREKRPVKIIWPDQAPNGLGTLMLPNTVAVVDGAPNAANARKFVEYLLRPEIETALAAGPSGQLPLLPGARAGVELKPPGSLRWMTVDFAAARDAWDAAADFVKREFAR